MSDDHADEEREKSAGSAMRSAADRHAERVNSGEVTPGGTAVDRSDDDEPSREELLAAVEEANDLLAEVMGDAGTYVSHDELRPSAVRGFDRAQDAHRRLCEVDPTRGSPDEEGER